MFEHLSAPVEAWVLQEVRISSRGKRVFQKHETNGRPFGRLETCLGAAFDLDQATLRETYINELRERIFAKDVGGFFRDFIDSLTRDDDIDDLPKIPSADSHYLTHLSVQVLPMSHRSSILYSLPSLCSLRLQLIIIDVRYVFWSRTKHVTHI